MREKKTITIGETIRDKKTGRCGVAVAKGWWLVMLQLSNDLDDDIEQMQYRQECDLKIVPPEAWFQNKENEE